MILNTCMTMDIYIIYLKDINYKFQKRGRRGHDSIVVGVGIPLMGRCSRYNFLIKLVSDLLKVCHFLRVECRLQVPPPIALTTTI